jgi:hypothetical protein
VDAALMPEEQTKGRAFSITLGKIFAKEKHPRNDKTAKYTPNGRLSMKGQCLQE